MPELYLDPGPQVLSQQITQNGRPTFTDDEFSLHVNCREKGGCQRTEAVERCGTYFVLQLIGGLMCLGNIRVDDLVSYE